MTPCTACGCHVRNLDAHCPVCGHARAPSRGVGAVALLLGLAACVGEGKSASETGDTGFTVEPDYGVSTTAEPEYGVSTTIPTTPTGGTGLTGSTGGTGSTTTSTGETGGTGSTGGVDYGVAIVSGTVVAPPPRVEE
jgi:hypothetical protein